MDDRDDEGTETTITRMSLRRGGWIGYTDDAVFVRRGDDAEGFKIRRDDIARITLNPLEWDLAVMGLLLVGIGAYVGVTRNVLVGIGFVVVGCWSLYRTYGKRYELVIRVDDEPKPVSVYPVDPKACHETLGDLIRAADADAQAEGEGEVTSEAA
jgi:hypothetical protein